MRGAFTGLALLGKGDGLRCEEWGWSTFSPANTLYFSWAAKRRNGLPEYNNPRVVYQSASDHIGGNDWLCDGLFLDFWRVSTF